MKLSLLVAALTALSTSISQATNNFGAATTIEFLASEIEELVTGNNIGATAEVNEPAHAGITAARSIWYSLTVDESRRVELVGAPGITTPINNIVLSVYTGTTLQNLQVVSRYKDLNVPASSRSRHPGGEPFTQRARVVFDAEPGTTYFIAVDSEANAQGSFELNLSTSRDTLTPEFELIPAGAPWSYYQALNRTIPTAPTTFNPATIDPDFYTTWHTAATYNGPAFSEPATSPFGYGAIDGEPVLATTLTTPAANERAAVTYFRTTFTPERNVQQLGFEGIFDDGAVIYLNGTEVARINVSATATLTSVSPALAASFTPPVPAISNEAGIQYAFASGLNLRAGEEVEIGVSLHNAGITSSDTAFHLRVYATQADPIPAEATLLFTEFANTYRIVWEGRKGFSYQVQFSDTSLDAGSWTTEAQGTDTPDQDGLITRFVLSTAPASFWRVVTTRVKK